MAFVGRLIYVKDYIYMSKTLKDRFLNSKPIRLSRMSRFSFIRLLLIASVFYMSSGFTQSPSPKMDALNYYVEFLNECSHGLSVAQIIFVNYNKDLNKHVDLQSHKINTHITNSEFGENIFDNPDINTTDSNRSAIHLSKLTRQESKHLSRQTAASLNKDVDQIVTILNKVNSLRFEIENFMIINDLDQKENIYKCYTYLEQTVGLFDQYAAMHDALSRKLRNQVVDEVRPMDFMFFEIHKASVEMLRVLRSGQTSGIDNYLRRIEGTLNSFRDKDYEFDDEERGIADQMVGQITEMVRFAKSGQTAALPRSYKNNSRHCFMHNTILMSYFNSIGPGFANKMNRLMDGVDPGFLHYDDRPVLYEVTYPQKMEELEEVATRNAVNDSESFPLDLTLKMDPLEEPPAVPAEPKQDYIELEFFDPDLIDRDSITVKLNEEILLDNYSMLEEPIKIRRDIDVNRNNSVTILAVNEGIISPNTIGFKYRFNGEGRKKTVIKRLMGRTAYELVLTLEGLGGLSDER